jgi:hypothetical protein
VVAEESRNAKTNDLLVEESGDTINKSRSVVEAGDSLGLCPSTVLRRMKRNGVPHPLDRCPLHLVSPSGSVKGRHRPLEIYSGIEGRSKRAYLKELLDDQEIT